MHEITLITSFLVYMGFIWWVGGINTNKPLGIRVVLLWSSNTLVCFAIIKWH